MIGTEPGWAYLRITLDEEEINFKITLPHHDLYRRFTLKWTLTIPIPFITLLFSFVKISMYSTTWLNFLHYVYFLVWIQTKKRYLVSGDIFSGKLLVWNNPPSKWWIALSPSTKAPFSNEIIANSKLFG